jgi:hypothetical protein
VVVVADARGTGFSEGSYDYYNFEEGTVRRLRHCGNGSLNSLGVTGMSASWGHQQQQSRATPQPLTKPAPTSRRWRPNMHPADFYHDQWRVGGSLSL